MTDETTKDPGAAPEAPPAEGPIPQTEPDRPHGDPLTGDEEHGTRHGVTPPEPEDAAEPEPEPEPEPQAEPEPEPEGDAVATAEAKAAEYLDLAQRKQAEFENFRRRMQAQVAAAEDKGVVRLAKELLPALDHLAIALQAADEHASGDEWVKGFRLVQDELAGALKRVGIESYAPLGQAFDPNEHEAMVQTPVDGFESGTVAQVYQAGYRLNGTVLRPARVIVAQ
jgi:molecular chaperone GrpE